MHPKRPLRHLTNLHIIKRREAIVLPLLLLLSTGFIFQSFCLPLPPKIKRVVFIGNSITYSGKYITDIEAVFTARYPKQRFEFINVGLPSETVSGLSEDGHAGGRFPRPDVHERLKRILEITQPDLVFVNYGMNDGIYLPLDEGRFAKFKTGITWLHGEVEKYGAKIVHVTPPIYDELHGTAIGYAAVLDAYAEWLLQQRPAAQWEVADMHFPMKKYLENERLKNPAFSFANDGVHPDDLGHWVMAQQILAYLGETGLTETKSIMDYMSTIKNGAAIYSLIAQKQQLMKDAWITAIKHSRPEMPAGLPLEEAKKKEKELNKKIRQLQ